MSALPPLENYGFFFLNLRVELAGRGTNPSPTLHVLIRSVLRKLIVSGSIHFDKTKTPKFK
jgi:hypothetical protein